MTKKQAVVLVCISGVSTLLNAAEIYTPALEGRSLYCSVVNVDKVPRNIYIQMIKTEGDTSEPLGSIRGMTLPGGSSGAGLVSSDIGSKAFCKITVKGPKDAVRGSLCVMNKNDCIAAVEAR